MATETELKLRITPENMRRLKRHPAFKSLLTSRAVTRKLHNVYFDTPQRLLQARGMALRLRRSGGAWMQALKGGGSVKSGLHQRDEWETPVDGAELDFAQLKKIGAPVLPKKIRSDLRPVFNTDFTRSSYQLEYDGAQIELCMDSGEIRAGDAQQPISELELELKLGEPRQLFKLALALLDTVPLEVEHCNKAEYGYRLGTHPTPDIAKAGPPQLKRCMRPAAALQEMMWRLLKQLQENVPGAIHTDDDEYLHRVRVTLRRLRVVLGIAKSLLGEDVELAALRAEFGMLFKLLGQAREWDVFMVQTLAVLRTRFPDHVGLVRMIERGERVRMLRQAAVQEALRASAFQRLLLRCAMWLHTEPCQSLNKKQRPSLMRFSAKVLLGYQRRVIRCGKKSFDAGDISAQALHALRLACKKLRYSMELFSALRTDEKQKRYRARLVRLLEVLGSLNDLAVAHRLLQELRSMENEGAEDLVRGWIERDHASQARHVRRAWVEFSEEWPSWR